MQKKILFIINPIAGIGGPLGLKGSDNFPAKELNFYIGPGYKKGILFIKKLEKSLDDPTNITFLTPEGYMGSDAFKITKFKYSIICRPDYPSTKNNTINCVKEGLKHEPELAVLVGGDGTLYDSALILKNHIPIIGVPGGTKIYSSVFTRSIRSAVHLIQDFINNEYIEIPGEIILVDEELLNTTSKYVVKDRIIVKSIESRRSRYHQETKDLSISQSDEENIEEIAEYIIDEKIDRNTLIILGPGNTTLAIARKLGFNKPLLGVALWYNEKVLCADCSSKEIYENILKTNPENIKIILSPLGESGFILGRGNQQITNLILERLDKKHLLLIATRRKMNRLKKLYIDTGNNSLDKKFSGYTRVIVGYNEEKIVRVETG